LRYHQNFDRLYGIFKPSRNRLARRKTLKQKKTPLRPARIKNTPRHSWLGLAFERV